MKQPDIRCINCGVEMVKVDLPADGTACPACGSTSLPCHIREDILLPINWHELRVLTIWASNFAYHPDFNIQEDSKHTLESLLTRLDQYRPINSPHLSLKDVKDRPPVIDLTDIKPLDKSIIIKQLN